MRAADEVPEHIRVEAINGILSLNLLGASTPAKGGAGVVGRVGWLLNLELRDVRRVRDVHFALSDDVGRMMDEALRLAQRLALLAEEEESSARAASPGRVNWPITLRTWAAGGDRSQFRVRRSSLSLDRPENRCFKFALTRVKQVAQDAAPEGVFPFGEGDWRAIVRERGRIAARCLALPVLRAIESPAQVTTDMIEAASSSRIPGFRAVARAAIVHRDLFNARGQAWGRVIERIARFYLFPAVGERLFELAMLSRVDSTLRQTGLARRSATLIGGRLEGTEISYVRAETRVTVHFQTVPHDVREKSAYLQVTQAHDLPAHIRTPDIVITVRRATQRRVILIEAKFTGREGPLRDALYQLFGYDFDFGFGLERFGPARGVVVSLVRLRRVGPSDMSVLLAHEEDFADLLLALVGSALAEIGG